jgi:hypothetical protein
MSLEEIRLRLSNLRRRRVTSRTQLESAAIQLAGESDPEAAEALRLQVEQFRSQAQEMRKREIVETAIELDPRRHVAQLDGAIPILLVPLRVQTRFDVRERRLLIRVYPDHFSVQEHETRLLPGERAVGEAFWAARDSSEETQPALWRGMVGKFGLPRAAWIMRVTNPNEPEDVGDVEHFVRIPAAWTLPERLVFRFFGGGDRLLGDDVIGLPIPDGLEMSFDITEDQLGFSRSDDDLQYPPELKWQVDFAEAVNVGMGVSVPLDRLGNPVRIERLIVLGVRLSTDQKQSADLLEQLIRDHRYSTGFSIVPQGTPTNITHDSDKAPALDVDRTLGWLSGEGAFSNDGRDSLYQDECDGLRLAHALGISPETMRYVERADCTDASESIAMRRALWAGTLGYYAQHMLSPLLADSLPPPFSAQSPERLILAARFYFTHFVFGRGPLPAFRVGSQPYGVLPVCADMLNRSDPHMAVWNETFMDAFVHLLHEKMVALSPIWLQQIANVPRAGAGANANARLLDVLATQASSVEWHAERLIGLEYLREYTNFKGKVLAFDAFAQMLLGRFGQFQAELPNVFSARPRIFNLTFFGGYWRSTVDILKDQINKLERGATTKLNGDVIDNLPLSESERISNAYPNYIKWLTANSFDEIRRGLSRVKSENERDPVTALLYMMLRHSYLYEHAFTAMRFHARFQNVPWTDFVEKELYNLTFHPDTLPWDRVSLLRPWPLGGPQPESTSVLDLITRRDTFRPALGNQWKTLFGDIDELFRSLAFLGSLPTARLERLFAEHMDLAGYRLDAWLTGYAFSRLLAYRVWRREFQEDRLNPLYESPRNSSPSRFDLNHRPLGPYSTGIYLGAYGWVEGLQQDEIPQTVQDIPPELEPRNNRPVTRDADNYGLIHAPSLNHAIAAALLRSASVTQPDVTAFNVDLSSSRVRDALWMLEGVRNGQMPAALLGYRFERRMRERKPGLLGSLPVLRAAFPMPRQQDTAAGPNEAIAARDVVNGLLVVQAHIDKTLDQKLADASVQAADRVLMTGIAAELVDTFDACGDLMLAESVYHASQGNYERAGGVVTAAGEFTHVPAEIDVTATPRSGTALSHRLIIALDGDVDAEDETSPRARLEPGLNRWLGSLIGDQTTLACTVTYLFTEDGIENSAQVELTLDQIGLEPIDLLFAVDDRSTNELLLRLDVEARPVFNQAHPDVPLKAVKLDPFSSGPEGTTPAGEIIQLLLQIRTMLSSASPATQRDFLPPQALHEFKIDDIDGIDENDLMNRVLGVTPADTTRDPESLWGRFQSIHDTFSDIDTLGLADLEDALFAAAEFGIPEAIPRFVPDADQIKSLRAQASDVAALMKARLGVADAKWTSSPKASEKDVLRVCREITESLLGHAFPVMPRLNSLPPEIQQAALEEGDPSKEDIEDWLFTSAAVREGAARLHRVRVLAEEFEVGFDDLQVFQFPVAQENWIAGEEDPDDPFKGDLVSIVVQPLEAFDLSTAEVTAGLVVDEWQDVIPRHDETTGITFHYDAPNAEPPQALLLAVSQRSVSNDMRWTWDELVECVNQALLIAKIRAVGPDELRKTVLDTVLPATLAAEAATPSTIATTFYANVDRAVAVAYDNIWSKT